MSDFPRTLELLQADNARREASGHLRPGSEPITPNSSPTYKGAIYGTFACLFADALRILRVISPERVAMLQESFLMFRAISMTREDFNHPDFQASLKTAMKDFDDAQKG